MKKLLALLLCLLLTGCGAEDLDEVVDPGWEEYQQQDELPEPVTNSYPSAFSLAFHKDHTLDPITCGEGIQQDVASLLYEPLFQLNEQFEPVGVLCEGAEWNETGLICTLHIRHGILFSDGSELTAADVFTTLRRAQESQRYAYRLRKVADISYSNRNMTVTISLTEKNTAFISLLDIPIVKKGTEQELVPTGTGPYLFSTDTEGTRLLVNPDWWQQSTLPADVIPLIHAKDEDTAIHLFSSDRVELLTLDPTAQHSAVSGSTDEMEKPTTLLHFIGFNTMNGIFADSAARAAFNAGIQREMLVDAFLSDHAITAYFPISPLSKLYPKELDGSYNYEKTLSAIAGAGYSTGEIRELTLLVNEEASFRLDNASYIAETLSLLDWKITVRVLPWTEYLIALEQGDFDLYYGQVRLSADWDTTDLMGTGGALNYGGFSDPLMDTLLREFYEADDRENAAHRLYVYFRQTVPFAPICFQNHTVLTHANVIENMSCAPGSTFYSLDKWTIHLAN